MLKICEKCIKTLNINDIPSEKLGVIDECCVCNKSQNTLYVFDPNNLLIFILQILKKSIDTSVEDSTSKVNNINETVIAEDSLHINDQFKT